MAMTFDILDHLWMDKAPRPGNPAFTSDPRPCGGSSPFVNESFWVFRLDGEAGDWLRERGHPGEFRVFERKDGAFLKFSDNELAMLFKLTWL